VEQVTNALLVLGGVAIVVGTLLSAVRTVVVPRPEQVLITRLVFGGLRPVFRFVARFGPAERGDRVLALYAPIALLSLPLVWLLAMLLAFTMLFVATGADGPRAALEAAGSSLLTLGFVRPGTFAGELVAFVGAALTIAIVVLLLVTYLPTMYASFSEREREITMLEARAGAPATGVELLTRLARIHGLGTVDDLWARWEGWFAAVHESHTSQPALAFFRSHRPDQHWVVAAGAVLDGAALFVACVDHAAARTDQQTVTVHRRGEDQQQVRAPAAELCLRAGFLALRDVARYFRLAFDDDPSPAAPISITREEFDRAWVELEAAGVPLVADREAAWVAWAGWRVNYDTPLLALAGLTWAPRAPWTSDRAPLPGTTG